MKARADISKNNLLQPFFTDYSCIKAIIDIGGKVLIFNDAIDDSATGRIGKSGYVFTNFYLLFVITKGKSSTLFVF